MMKYLLAIIGLFVMTQTVFAQTILSDSIVNKGFEGKIVIAYRLVYWIDSLGFFKVADSNELGGLFETCLFTCIMSRYCDLGFGWLLFMGWWCVFWWDVTGRLVGGWWEVGGRLVGDIWRYIGNRVIWERVVCHFHLPHLIR